LWFLAKPNTILARMEGWVGCVNGARRADVELLRQISAGDVRAFETLYGRYGRMAYALCLRLLRDPSEAEEVAQDAFLRVWRQAARFDAGRGTLATWVLTITHHLVIDHIRRRQGDAIPSSPAVDTMAGGCAEDPSEWAVTRTVASQIRWAMLSLAQEQRQALWLTYFAGYTHREAADVLAVPLGTVKSRVRLALHNLRRLISAHITDLTASSSIQAPASGGSDPARHPLRRVGQDA
jgi:RNA polymerase sigma-70 factor (ECF subfamily)